MSKEIKKTKKWSESDLKKRFRELDRERKQVLKNMMITEEELIMSELDREEALRRWK